MVISRQRVTLDEFLRMPEAEPALELIGGVIKQKVSPKGPHGMVQGVITHLFRDYAWPRRLGVAFPETRVSFGGQSAVPDVIFYHWDRVPRTPTGRVADDFTTPPDIVVEIISPGQRINALARRCRWYVDNGVPIVLLIDPRRETVMLFRAGAEPLLIAGDTPIELEPVLAGFHLTARQLFDALYFR